MVLWACACVGPPPAPPADGTTPGAGDGSSSGGTTAPVADADSTSGTSTSSADTSTTGSESTSSAEGHPLIVLSQAPVFDFGSRGLSETVEQLFTVTNAGDGDATALEVAVQDGALSIADDGCGDVLVAGAACDVRVVFAPARFGDFTGELQVAFEDQGVAGSAVRLIVGRGVGETGNLLVNGGGELGNAIDTPPMGWFIGYGPSWSANWPEATPVEGNRTISAGWGPPGPNQFTLYQQVPVAPLTTWGDAAGVRFYYRAFHRAETDGNDPTWVELRFHDAAGAELAVFPSSPYAGTTWNESVGNFVAPAGTHHVRMSLECDRVVSDWCSGFFDGLEVWAEWVGP